MLSCANIGCGKDSQGIKDHPVIDKIILSHCKRHQIKLCMARIDLQKAYDMVLHSWISETLQMFGIADNSITVLKNNEYVNDVIIKRGIFQVICYCVDIYFYVSRRQRCRINVYGCMDNLKEQRKDRKTVKPHTNISSTVTRKEGLKV